MQIVSFWRIDWQSWVVGIDFVEFPWWGSLHFGPLIYGWSRVELDEPPLPGWWKKGYGP